MIAKALVVGSRVDLYNKDGKRTASVPLDGGEFAGMSKQRIRIVRGENRYSYNEYGWEISCEEKFAEKEAIEGSKEV